jgi:two-component system, OmpR family, KDP operon response regulator KdpE
MRSNQAATVLVVDDDVAARHVLRDSLKALGYPTRDARASEEALKEIAREPADVVLLDVSRSGISGIETCRRLRAVAPRAWIVVMTGQGSEEDPLRALEAGADDYITKPVNLCELLVRLRALTRRLGTALAASLPVLRVGDLELDVERRTLRRNGAAVHLSPMEFALLSYLMRNANLPIENRQLLRTIWGPEYVGAFEHLRIYINRLRKKIENDSLHPEYLVTLPRHGYRFLDPTGGISIPAETGPRDIPI